MFLKSYLTKHGVTFIRRKVDHINEAFLSPSTEVVFNCTGLGAKTLGGVEDGKVYPTRGQVAVVRAPHIQENMGHNDHNFITYCIPRPFSGGHVVLGGYYQPYNGNTDTFGDETASILERTAKYLPKLKTDKPLEIIREYAGLRPSREGGARIEKEIVDSSRVIIHNYGASGTGYQSGLAMATDAVNLLPSDPKL